MIDQLVEDIAAYFKLLRTEYGDFVAFHNASIPLNNYMDRLTPYNINSNPFCLCVKSDKSAWDYCIARQHKVVDRCQGGAFCGICYAGMGECVFPIQDQSVLGFLSVSGFRLDDHTSFERIRSFARRYGFEEKTLRESYQRNVTLSPPDLRSLSARIAPLSHMFVLLNRELVPLHEKFSAESASQSYVLSHAVVYIAKNYAAPIRAADLASFCHCSVSSISHMFKQKTGRSISEYVNDIRIKDAKKLLASTDLSVQQVSEMVGFCNPNYFCKVYKQVTGLSPREDSHRNTSGSRSCQ